MLDDRLRDRLRSAASGISAPRADLHPVTRRARILRGRRVAVAACGAAVVAAALGWPLISLSHLGERADRMPGTTETGFTFSPAPGWTVHRVSDIAVWATNQPAFASGDEVPSPPAEGEDPRSAVWSPNETIRSLPADGVVVVAWVVSDRFQWVEPGGTFQDRPLSEAIGCGGIEGELSGQTKCNGWSYRNHRYVQAQVFLGSEGVTELPDAVGVELDRLSVPDPESLGSPIAFEPAEGWQVHGPVPQAGPEAIGQWVSNVDVPTESDLVWPLLPDGDQVHTMPEGGIAISAYQPLETRNSLEGLPGFPQLSLPLRLEDTTPSHGPEEGYPWADKTTFVFNGVINGRVVSVQVIIHSPSPASDVLRAAQTELDRLVVVPPPTPVGQLEDFGIRMEVPSGWTGRLYGWGPFSDHVLVATDSPTGTPFDVMSVLDGLGPTEAAIVLAESAASMDLDWEPVELPVAIGLQDACPACEVLDGGRPPAPGHALFRRTFVVGGRAFDLNVEFGSTPTADDLARLNQILATLRIEPISVPSPSATPAESSGQSWIVARANGGTEPLDVGSIHLDLAPGWWGKADPEAPATTDVLVAAGTWDFPAGADCGPADALATLPPDGALVWIRQLTDRPGNAGDYFPWPDRRPAADPTAAPAAYACTHGVAAQRELYTLAGQYFEVYLVFGPASPESFHDEAWDVVLSFRLLPASSP